MAFAAARMIIQREARENRKSMDCSAFRGGEGIRAFVTNSTNTTMFYRVGLKNGLQVAESFLSKLWQKR